MPNDSTQPVVEIERVTTPTEDVRALVGELEAELAAHYPSHQRHGLALDALFQPHIRFFVAKVTGRAVGCGGIALYNDFAEIKRMYVRPESRGTVVAEAIIARLTKEALSAGLTLLRLETGTLQAAAIKFYRRCGFAVCAAFEPYSSMPPDKIASSVFMQMPIRAR